MIPDMIARYLCPNVTKDYPPNQGPTVALCRLCSFLSDLIDSSVDTATIAVFIICIFTEREYGMWFRSSFFSPRLYLCTRDLSQLHKSQHLIIIIIIMIISNFQILLPLQYKTRASFKSLRCICF